MHLLAPGGGGGRRGGARRNVAFTAILCQVQQVQVRLHRGAKHLSFLLNLVVPEDREATFYLFIYLWLCWMFGAARAFSDCSELRLLSSGGVQPSLGGDFRCRAQALGCVWASVVAAPGR